MTRLIVTREDTGEILAAHGWTKDLQEARLFGHKSSATNAARTTFKANPWARRPEPSSLPKFQHSEVLLVSAEDYAAIQRDLDKLNALEAAGVDNWKWYDETMRSLSEGDDD